MSTDYGRQLNREYERALLRVEELERENRELKAKNRQLRNRVGELENTLEERIKKAVDAAIAKAVAPLNARIAELEAITEHRYPLMAGEAVPPPRVEYGDKPKGLTIVLSMEDIVALQRISDFFKEVSGGLVSPCRATVERIIEGFAERLSPELEKIRGLYVVY